MRDAVSGVPLGGVAVHVDGVGDATTNAAGGFDLPADPPLGLRSVRLTGTGVVDRDTYLSVPGPAAVLPLIPTSVDLAAFDEMFRGNGGALWRWTTTPSLLMEMRVLEFANLTDTASTAAAETMNGQDADGILADLRWGLGQLTGETYRDFANVQRVTANAGDLVSLTHSGVIFVARSKGLRAATGDIGYARWATDGAGRVQGGAILLDSDFDASGDRDVRALRVHELGHALGYNHVTVRTSVMNPVISGEPTDFDRTGAKVAFERPPLNRSPDVDPSFYTANPSGGPLRWTRGEP